MCQGFEYDTVVYAKITEFRIYLNVAQYAPVMPECALMSFNMPEHG